MGNTRNALLRQLDPASRWVAPVIDGGAELMRESKEVMGLLAAKGCS
jgi:hypothetical protein